MSLSGLARSMGLPVVELAAAEQGETRLSAESLFQISVALRVPVRRIVDVASPNDSTVGADVKGDAALPATTKHL